MKTLLIILFSTFCAFGGGVAIGTGPVAVPPQSTNLNTATVTTTQYPINSNAIVQLSWPPNLFTNAVNGTTVYSVFVATNQYAPVYFTNYNAGTNLSLLVSNLVDTNWYQFAVSGSNGSTSLGLSQPLWRQLNPVFVTPVVPGISANAISP